MINTDSYQIGQHPMMYGGQQEDFVRRGEEIIAIGVEQVIKAKNEGEDLTKVFFNIFNLFATERHDIADSHDTPDKKYFGRQRMDCEGDIAHTGLHIYKEFNTKFMSFLTDVLKKSIPIKGDLKKTKFTVGGEYLNRKCTFEIELIDLKKLKELEWDVGLFDSSKREAAIKNFRELTTQFPGCMEPISEENYPPTKEEQSTINAFCQYHRALKKNYPTHYRHQKMHFMIDMMEKAFPCPTYTLDSKKQVTVLGDPNNAKSIRVVCKVRIEINNSMYALSDYITWTYRDFVEDPVERLKNSTIVIMHQDRYLIDGTMQEIAKIFASTLQLDSENEKALKDQVGLIRYLFAHAMPLVRGSATVGEWFEKLIYRFHGFNCVHSKKTMGDMEAFVAPLWSTFQKEKYESTIELIKNH